MRLYPALFKTVFSGMDPERAHHVGVTALRSAEATRASRLLRPVTRPDDSLRVEAMGLSFPSPFGLAAGFDKGGTSIAALAELGFGHLEIGTVTAQGQPGNPRPRLFRLEQDRALINRMGFNNEGAGVVGPRLAAAHADLEKAFKPQHLPAIGVNIGKTKATALEDAVEDYLFSARTVGPQADYLAVNVSSPNTPGLRDLQDPESLRPLLKEVGQAADRAAGRHVPLLVKIAPDLTGEHIEQIAELAEQVGLDGIIATNTTIEREGLGLRADAQTVRSYGVGGLSGAPLKSRSEEVLDQLRGLVGDRLCLISVGGVTDADDVQRRLDRGATLVQGYTAFLYQGPLWVARINRGLARPAGAAETRGHDTATLRRFGGDPGGDPAEMLPRHG